jgi:hypothetical protein
LKSSIREFVLRLLDRPDLAKYVSRVELRPYSHLTDLGYVSGPKDFEGWVECGPDEYERLTKAAVNAGVITHVLLYEPESSIGIDFRNFEKQSIPVAYSDEVSYANVYDNRQSSLHNLPFDTQFYELLRYGLEESYIILLMAFITQHPRSKTVECTISPALSTLANDARI